MCNKIQIIGKAIKEGWKLSVNQEGLVLIKGKVKLVFGIKITTNNNVIICSYVQREYKIAAILASTGSTMSIKKAHIMTWHHDEERTCRIALELGWPLKKGLMMPCKGCSIRKARQLAVNKHVNNRKKATRASKRIFSDLATI